MKRSQGPQSGPKAKPVARLAAAKEGTGEAAKATEGEEEEAFADRERARRPSGKLLAALPLGWEPLEEETPEPPLLALSDLSAAASSNSCSGAGASAAEAWYIRRHESDVSSTA